MEGSAAGIDVPVGQLKQRVLEFIDSSLKSSQEGSSDQTYWSTAPSRLTPRCYERFYIGQKRNLDNAYNQMVNHLMWRKEIGFPTYDDIKDCVAYKKGVVQFHGKAKENDYPLMWVFLGRYNKHENTDYTLLQKFVVCVMDECAAKHKEERLVSVIDLSGFGLHCVDYTFVKILIDAIQTNYTEVLKRALLVNAPFAFRAVWAIVRPWIDPETASKIVFVSSPENVLEYVEVAEMPETFVLPAHVKRPVVAVGGKAEGEKKEDAGSS